MLKPLNPFNFIPPAGIINAEYLVIKFSKELIGIHKELKTLNKWTFDERQELLKKAKTLKHKILYYKNFYGFN
jgi:hypothetical protein